MTDRRGSAADDDEVPRPPAQPPRDRAISISVLDSAAKKEQQDNDADGGAVQTPKQSGDGANSATAARADLPRPSVDRALAEQVDQVMASEVLSIRLPELNLS